MRKFLKTFRGRRQNSFVFAQEFFTMPNLDKIIITYSASYQVIKSLNTKVLSYEETNQQISKSRKAVATPNAETKLFYKT